MRAETRKRDPLAEFFEKYKAVSCQPSAVS